MKSQVEKAAKKSNGTEPRNRPSVVFVYTDLENAIEIVKGVHAAGGNSCEHDQLAAQLGLEAKGGGFRLREIGAKAYGLLTYERGCGVVLTDLGKRIIDSQHERASRVEAFLNIELNQKVFEQFKGSQLPPQAGLERALVNIGVGEKVKDKARQVLLRSAKQAGFFELSQDRLTKPPIKNEPPQKNEQDSQDNTQQSGSNNGGDGGGIVYHPFITGLLQTLPPVGEEWSVEERMNWLNIANGVFKLLYKGGTEEIEVKITQ